MRLTKQSVSLLLASFFVFLTISCGRVQAEEAYPTGPAWEANWIWDAGEASPHNFYLYARKEIELPADAVSAKIRVTADSRYILYINDHIIGRGPVKSDRRWLYYDEWEINNSNYFLWKTVTIAALVNHYGEWTFSYMEGRGGFILEADIEMKDGKHIKIVTDKTWKVKPGEAWFRGLQRMSVQQGFPEVYDARKEPFGWNDVNYDDSGWQNATELGRPPVEPWPRLIKRMTPPQTRDFISQEKLIDFGDAIPGPRNEGVDFTQLISGDENSVAYAGTYLYSPKDSKASLVLSSKNACKLYLNGKTLITNFVATGINIENSKKYAELSVGWTPLVVKCVKNAPGWDFSLAVDAPERNGFVFSNERNPDKTGWGVIGPFKKTGKLESEYKKEYPPQKELDFTKSYEGADGKTVSWKIETETDKMTTRLAASLAEMELKPLKEGRVEEKGQLCQVVPCFVKEVQTKPGGAVYFILDFGWEVAGFTNISLTSETGGEMIDIGYSELLLDKDGKALSPINPAGGHVNPGKSDVNYADRYITRAGAQEFVTFNRHAFRYMLLVVRNAVKPKLKMR